MAAILGPASGLPTCNQFLCPSGRFGELEGAVLVQGGVTDVDPVVQVVAGEDAAADSGLTREGQPELSGLDPTDRNGAGRSGRVPGRQDAGFDRGVLGQGRELLRR
jgi:hypothetical protein